MNRPVDPATVCWGEIGLAGELRAISDSERRIAVQSLKPPYHRVFQILRDQLFSHAAPMADADEHAPCHHGDVGEYVSDYSIQGVPGHLRQMQKSHP